MGAPWTLLGRFGKGWWCVIGFRCTLVCIYPCGEGVSPFSTRHTTHPTRSPPSRHADAREQAGVGEPSQILTTGVPRSVGDGIRVGKVFYRYID